ncbi:MAG: hypothetical protein KDB35_22960 [Acidimicrobiales bacterium]|nr:hypothetical protein [Acidimicrobiales bacterium]
MQRLGRDHVWDVELFGDVGRHDPVAKTVESVDEPAELVERDQAQRDLALVSVDDDGALAAEQVGDHYGRRIKAAATRSEREQILVELVDDFMAMLTTHCADLTVVELERARSLVEQRVGHLRLMLEAPPATS